MKEAQKTEDERDRVSGKSSDLAEKLFELTGGDRTGKFVSRLEDTVKNGEKLLNESYLRFAETFFENQKAFPAKDIDDSIAKSVKAIQSLQKENRDHEKMLKRYQAHIAVLETRKKVENAKKRIEMINRDIMRKNEEKEAIQKSIEKLEEEEKAQLKARGPEDTLFPKADETED